MIENDSMATHKVFVSNFVKYGVLSDLPIYPLVIRCWNKHILPLKYRSEILDLARVFQMTGHLRVNKMQHKILQHFYWPKLRRSVMEFMRTCQVCQMVGKPIQNVAPAPVKPVMYSSMNRIAVTLQPLKVASCKKG